MRGAETAAYRRAKRKQELLIQEREKAMDHLAQYPEAMVNVRTACYRSMLLHKDGWMMSQGIAYWIRGKSLGAGVYQVKLEVKD